MNWLPRCSSSSSQTTKSFLCQKSNTVLLIHMLIQHLNWYSIRKTLLKNWESKPEKQFLYHKISNILVCEHHSYLPVSTTGYHIGWASVYQCVNKGKPIHYKQTIEIIASSQWAKNHHNGLARHQNEPSGLRTKRRYLFFHSFWRLPNANQTVTGKIEKKHWNTHTLSYPIPQSYLISFKCACFFYHT